MHDGVQSVNFSQIGENLFFFAPQILGAHRPMNTP